MARRSGLGKGLGALIPTEVANEGSSALLEVPVTAVSPNNFQPRRPTLLIAVNLKPPLSRRR